MVHDIYCILWSPTVNIGFMNYHTPRLSPTTQDIRSSPGFLMICVAIVCFASNVSICGAGRTIAETVAGKSFNVHMAIPPSLPSACAFPTPQELFERRVCAPCRRTFLTEADSCLCLRQSLLP